MRDYIELGPAIAITNAQRFERERDQARIDVEDLAQKRHDLETQLSEAVALLRRSLFKMEPTALQTAHEVLARVDGKAGA